MRIYCINLARNPERKNRIKQSLLDIGIEAIQWIEAVDGKGLSSEEIKHCCNLSYQKLSNKRVFYPGEIGCVLSHHKAYKAIIESTDGYGLILEDDALPLSDSLSIQLDKIRSFVDTDEPRILLLSRIKRFYSNSKQPVADMHIVEVARSRGGYAYVVNAAAARILLDTNTPIRYVTDDWKRAWFLSRGKLKINAALPPLFSYDDQGQSSIMMTDDEIAYRESRHGRKVLTTFFTLPLKLSLKVMEWLRPVKEYPPLD